MAASMNFIEQLVMCVTNTMHTTEKRIQDFVREVRKDASLPSVDLEPTNLMLPLMEDVYEHRKWNAKQDAILTEVYQKSVSRTWLAICRR